MSPSANADKTMAVGSPSASRKTRARPSETKEVSRDSLPKLAGLEWELVLRIAASQRFQRSPLLTNFLLYISEQSLTGNAARINEHMIGVQVFGRDEQFNRSDDNIVRNYARMLRTRLEGYFNDEGSDELLRLEIPRGGYIPVFSSFLKPDEEISQADPQVEELLPEPTPLPVPAPPRSRVLLHSGWLVLVGVILGFALSTARSWNWEQLFSSTGRLNHLFWTALFDPHHEAIVVPSDGGFVILHRFLEQPTPLSDYVSGSYRSTEVIASGLKEMLHTLNPAELSSLSRKVEALGDRRYTGVADLDIATRISGFAELPPDRLKVRYARDLRTDDLKNSNVVLIGSVDANPWVALFQPELNFQFTEGGSFGGSAVIVNRKPLPGEAKTFASITGDPAQRTYGVIAYVPNLGGTGHVLIVEGINMAGTQAAGEFLLDRNRMADIIRRARKPGGDLHPFEILLETSSVGANSSQLRVLSTRISTL